MSPLDIRRFHPVRGVALALPFLLAACGGGRGDAIEMPGPVENPLAAAAATITPEDMYERIAFLASDELRGRDTPSPGLETAARYITDEFRRMGLEGGAEAGEFIQRYPFPLVGLDTLAAALVLGGVTDAPALEFGTDFIIAAGDAESVSGPLWWVGPAAAFAEAEWAAGSLTGRLPVAYLPGPFNRDLQIAMNRARTAARAAGAQAIVFALSPELPDAEFEQVRGFLTRPRRTLGALSDPTIVLLRHGAAQTVLRAGQLDLDAVAMQPCGASEMPPCPRLGDLTGNLTARVNVFGDDTAPNVLAILRGSDPQLADEYVIFSAHMDHVGVGRPDESGDSIYNGADDDASGTSALIEVAEAFSNLLQRPRRSLVFLAVSGEEKGLLGSRWFSDNPTLPLENVVANINVDMIGRNAPDTIVVIGQEYSSLGPLVQDVGRAHPELGLTVSEDIWPEERFFFRSDHFNFARKEIPALFFFTGVHEDYHRPSDEVETIDQDKASRVARLIFYTAHAIADAPARPQWTDEGLAEIRALTGGRR